MIPGSIPIDQLLQYIQSYSYGASDKLSNHSKESARCSGKSGFDRQMSARSFPYYFGTILPQAKPIYDFFVF